ncbi:hypothetical protein ACFDAU_08330 [Sulfuriferula sp. GW1]|uniref:hypothetical protein n=1 Tax=Sulfuriferula sp. GW1 TaxID=3345111 RepID=UPI0039B10BFC
MAQVIAMMVLASLYLALMNILPLDGKPTLCAAGEDFLDFHQGISKKREEFSYNETAHPGQGTCDIAQTVPRLAVII